TPGRLIDHMGTGTVKLGNCHTFILDEADRMLDMGFIDEVKEMQAALREDHQTVMFSATMNPKVRRLSGELLNDPEYVEQVRKNLVAETITHKLMNVRRKNKTDLLIELLKDESIDKALIFSRTKIGADNICGMLKEAFRDTPMRVDAIHGDKKQRTREKILLNFRKGRTKFLVATDVAARGIDVDGISHVINYELPIEAENYVHRVGRTGRAGQTGIAISFCDPSDMRLLKEIESLLKSKIDVDENHKYHFDISEMREFKKGGKGKFGRSRDRKKEGGYSKKRSDGPGSKRKEFNKPDRSTRRPEKSEYSDKPRKKAYHNDNDNGKFDNVKSKYAAKPKRAYDPTRDNYKNDSVTFDDDPVLQKLRGKPVRRKPTEQDETKGKRQKKYDKKQDTAIKGKKRKPQAKRGNDPSKTKQTGGHKTFSPKRTILRTNRAS
ncbi:MAG: DEAD/DEAH box helicase, partial [Emcibacteraceae bacterium]|nr:DEAD/DEAH box helicase [Emcibacteraceae bacterium]